MPALQSTYYQRSMKLARSELVDASARCPVCLVSGPRAVVHRLQEEPAIDFLRCARCGACSAEHMPTTEVLERYYANYYDGAEHKVTHHDIDKLARHVWRSIVPAVFGDRLRILDFGGGEGLLSKGIARLHRAARPAGFTRIDLVDFQATQPEETDAFSLTQVRTLAEAPGAHDLVLASAILEHVPQLNGVLRALFERLSSPGFFYARTPYIEPFCRFSRHIDVTYPGHVHDLGDRFWNRVVETFGLSGARVVLSQPSPVETRFQDAPLRTLAAHVLKLPARLEARLRRPQGGRRLWTLVGGWEAVLRFDAAPLARAGERS